MYLVKLDYVYRNISKKIIRKKNRIKNKNLLLSWVHSVLGKRKADPTRGYRIIPRSGHLNHED